MAAQQELNLAQRRPTTILPLRSHAQKIALAGEHQCKWLPLSLPYHILPSDLLRESETVMANDVCPWRHAYLFDNPLRRLLHNPRSLLGPYVKPGDTVMDVGCGMGFFSIGMARLVGDDGCVFAVDLQQEMLDVLVKRATRKGLIHRIKPHCCGVDTLGVYSVVDFIVAFWMVHEVPDRGRLLDQLRNIISNRGKLLIVEPKGHVSSKEFETTVAIARDSGWRDERRVPVRMSRAAVLGTQSSEAD